MMWRRFSLIGSLLGALIASAAHAGGTAPAPPAAAVPQPFGSTPPRYDTATCNQVRAKQQQAIESGVLADLQRGPDWARGNLSPARLVEIESFISLDEQLKFGCREAVLSPDALQARDAAKKLEADPNADPNAPAAPPAKPKVKPAPVGGPQKGAAVESGFDPTPNAAKDKVILKPKRERRPPDAYQPPAAPAKADPVAVEPPANGGGASLQFNAAPAAAAAREAPARKWVPIGDAPDGGK